MTDQPVGLPRYDILEGSGVSTLNALLMLYTGSQPNTVLTLRDPESGDEFPVTLVEVHIEHDPDGGAIFFDGKLDSGSIITGSVRLTVDETFKVGQANIKF